MKYRETAHKMAIATAAALEYIEAQNDWAIAIELIKYRNDMIDNSINSAWIAECDERVTNAFATWAKVHNSFPYRSVERARTSAMWEDMKGSHVSR